METPGIEPGTVGVQNRLAPLVHGSPLVGARGFEPLIFSLSEKRFNQTKLRAYVSTSEPCVFLESPCDRKARSDGLANRRGVNGLGMSRRRDLSRGKDRRCVRGEAEHEDCVVDISAVHVREDGTAA